MAGAGKGFGIKHGFTFPKEKEKVTEHIGS